jgi:hypothetical protein
MIRTIATFALVATTAMMGLAPQAALAKSKTAKACKQLEAINPDNDGTLDLDEVKKAAGAVFDRLNKDNDGTLDAKELRRRLKAKEIAASDPDKDGTIDKNEYLAVVEARFKLVNRDADTTIDCKELASKPGKALMRLLK